MPTIFFVNPCYEFLSQLCVYRTKARRGAINSIILVSYYYRIRIFHIKV